MVRAKNSQSLQSNVTEIDHYRSGGLIVLPSIISDDRKHIHVFEIETATALRFRGEEIDVEIAVLPPDASDQSDKDEGILLLTGYPSNTCEHDCWSDAENLGIDLVKNAMSRNRFQKLKPDLHFVDNGTVSQHAQYRSSKGFRATGTIRENRINHEFPLEESKSMQKKERGTSNFAFNENS
ncbi:hypothetical protein TNCV_1600941 [Trichonephila clavipes]|nr:hypothetical protein TNCV_1600941 [Trichonephila clavipes]